MNYEYISGFFDADGSITLSKQKKNSPYRGIKIDFTNTYKEILCEIQQYLLNFDIKTYLSIKPSKKITHSDSYTLSLQGSYAYKLCFLLNSMHPKKKHRINCIVKYWKIVTIKNGKYSLNQKNRKLAFERLFFKKFL